MRLILKKHRFLIAFTLSIALHFFAFFVCPHLNQTKHLKEENTLTYEVVLLEPSICVPSEPSSMPQEISISDIVQKISLTPIQEITPAIIKEETTENLITPKLVKDIQQIDENALPQKIETSKTEIPKPIKKPIRHESQQIPKTEIVLKKTLEQPKSAQQKNIIPSKNELNIMNGHENTSHHQQNASSDNSDHEAPIMPIQKAKLRGKLIMPPYPKRAFDMDLEGEVTLQVLIDKLSQIKDIRIIHHKGSTLFCTSTINTIKKEWNGLIEPHQQNGQFIEGWIEITIPFTIERK